MTHYLAVLHLATAGSNGPLLGTDEEEIVFISLVVINTVNSQVAFTRDFWVKPRSADYNENILSEQARDELGLTDELIRTHGNSFEQVLSKADQFLRSVAKGIEGSEAGQPNGQSSAENIVLVTDGQLPLRQCLLPETCTKGIGDVPPAFCLFFDLRKEFRQCFAGAPEAHSVQDMLSYLNLEYEDSTSTREHNVIKREAQDMGRIVQRLLKEGHKFENPETINLRLEPGICSKDEEVDSNTVVRARGLPWQSSDQDIARFFRGLNVARGGVALCLSAQGRRNGEALVRFVSAEHRDMALKRHKHHIGQRYIEVYKATGEDFVDIAGGSNNEAQNFLSRNGQVIVRMRGLPYDCTAKQVVEFFDSGREDGGCSVLDGESGVLFVKKHDGRATGDAFVMFATEEEGSRALAKHRDIIGSRYIELFRSTTAEVQQVLNRSMDPRTYETQAPLIQQLPQIPLLPQQMITSGTRKDCVRLRGLPYEAQVEHILEFLGEHAKNIVYQGVHMVYNAQGQPSGEAFIQMDSEQSSFQAAQQRHHRYMIFGKKQRYIEVFQCSGEDMHLVLTGGLALPTTPAASTPKALLSPGMLSWDPLNTPAGVQAQLLQAQAAALHEQVQAQAQVQAQLAAHAIKQQQDGLWLMGLAPHTTNPSLSRPPPTPASFTLANARTAAGSVRASTQTTPGLLGQPGGRPVLLPGAQHALSHLNLGLSPGLNLQELAALHQLAGSGVNGPNPLANPLFLLNLQQSQLSRPGNPLGAYGAVPKVAAGPLVAAVPANPCVAPGKRSWDAAFHQQQDPVAAMAAAAAAAKRPWPLGAGGSGTGAGSSSSLSFPSSIYPAL